jgi:hypothetical protein
MDAYVAGTKEFNCVCGNKSFNTITETDNIDHLFKTAFPVADTNAIF